MSLKKPKVYFIGANYFGYEFMSIKSHKAFEQTDILVYDNTINQNFINSIPFKMKKINLDIEKNIKYKKHISSFLYSLSSQDNVVTRLTNVNAFCFHNLFKEIKMLKDNQVDFEVIPTLSLESCVSIYASIPFYNQHNYLVVSCDSNIDYKTASNFKGTLILKHFVDDYYNIMNTFFSNGVKKDTPSCLIEIEDNYFNRKFYENLSKIPKLIKENNIKDAVLVIGDICLHHKEISPDYLKPLSDVKILIPILKYFYNDVAGALTSKGAAVNQLVFAKYKSLDFDINLQFSEFLFFTTYTSVSIFFDKIKSLGLDARIFKDKKVIAIGDTTAKELLKNGILCDFTVLPDMLDSTVSKFKKKGILKKDSIITVFRGDGIALDLINKLEKENIDYHDVLLYNIEFIPNNIEDIKSYKYILFYNLNLFYSFLSCMEDNADLSWVNAICFGHTTEIIAKKYNMKTHICEKPDANCIVNKIVSLEKNKK